jgi:hypothetical protein
MKFSSKIVLTGLAALGMAASAFGQESAIGTVNLQSINGTGPSQTFTYNIVLKDNGSTNIGSFWYSWIPYSRTLPDNYYNFLPSKPTAETSPTGWSPTIVGPGIFDPGYSIQWDASADPMTPGSTDDFGFTTPDNFATVTGSTFGFPSGYAYVYTGGPEAAGDNGGVLVVAAGTSVVPEPASLGMIAVAASALCLRRRKRLAAIPCNA